MLRKHIMCIYSFSSNYTSYTPSGVSLFEHIMNIILTKRWAHIVDLSTETSHVQCQSNAPDVNIHPSGLRLYKTPLCVILKALNTANKKLILITPYMYAYI